MAAAGQFWCATRGTYKLCFTAPFVADNPNPGYPSIPVIDRPGFPNPYAIYATTRLEDLKVPGDFFYCYLQFRNVECTSGTACTVGNVAFQFSDGLIIADSEPLWGSSDNNWVGSRAVSVLVNSFGFTDLASTTATWTKDAITVDLTPRDLTFTLV